MRRLLTPKWVAVHVLAVAAVLVQLRLAEWQWHRAHGGGGLQSLGYAVQWPAFAAFTVFFWLRFARDELRGVHRRAPKVDRAALERRVAAPEVDDSDDPELAAYNAYLRGLADREAPRRQTSVVDGAPGAQQPPVAS